VKPHLLAVVALASLAAPAFAQVPDSLPAGVTAAMIAQGKTLFAGPGLCSVCHGADAKGLPNLGVNLTDREWLHSDGSYQALVKQVTTGVPAGQSKSGIVMPPKGGSAITDEQVRAVAAYVWSLSHQHAK
jgi:mono/diheme cytochrome c family protein